MAQNEEKKPKVPPYIPFKTFKNFLDGLGDTIPGRIDRSLMPSHSGTAQAHLLHALKHFELISSNGVPSEKLHQLVKSESAEWQANLKDLLNQYYPFLFHQDLNIKTATGNQVFEKFVQAGASGATVRKCIAFFTGAAESACLEISPYIKTFTRSKRAGGAKSRRNNEKQQGPIASESHQAKERSSQGWMELMVSKFPALDPAWPDDVKAKWFDAFRELMKEGGKQNK